MTTSAGRKTVSYLVKCALASNDSLVKADQNGNNYTFAGGIGLCPAWKTRRRGDQRASAWRAISACMMAHVNTAGVHVPLWLDSNDTPSAGASTASTTRCRRGRSSATSSTPAR